TILTSAGIAGFGVNTFLVGKAVLKAQPTVDKIKVDTEHFKAKHERQANYSRSELEHDVTKVWLQGSLELLKIFGPAIATGAFSVACLIAAHNLSRRNQAALAAAYTPLPAGYKAYRK